MNRTRIENFQKKNHNTKISFDLRVRGCKTDFLIFSSFYNSKVLQLRKR